MRLIVVEDDVAAAHDLTSELEPHGFILESVRDGPGVIATPLTADLVLLSLDLRDLDGVEVCRRIRRRSEIPIIGMSDQDAVRHRLEGLWAGLDDYVLKPLHYPELVMRIGATMRRVRCSMTSPLPAAVGDVTVGDLRINLRSREVRLAGATIRLTRKEFDLLALLASDPGTVFSRKEIMRAVWKVDVAQSSRTIDTHVATLRAKLGCRSWVATVHGFGFRFGSLPSVAAPKLSNL